MNRLAFIALVLFGLVSGPHDALAQTLAAAKHAEEPPVELADPIKLLLASGGQKATVGTAEVIFWWVKAVPLKPGSAPAAWGQVPEGTLVGAVRLSAALDDIRGRRIKAGVYTLRYGVQPDNGDHLGVSPFRDFLLLSPVSLDKDPATIEHDPLAEMSGKSIGSSHPAAWSIDPPAATEEVLSIRTNEAGHKSVILQVPAARDGKDAGTIRFGLILIGEIEA